MISFHWIFRFKAETAVQLKPQNQSEVISSRKITPIKKMRPLATTRLMMTWLSMCPPDELTATRQKRIYIGHTSAVLTLNVIGFASSLAYCLKMFSTDFDGAVYGFMAAIADFGVIYFMIAAFLMRHQIDNIFTGLSEIYDSST